MSEAAAQAPTIRRRAAALKADAPAADADPNASGPAGSNTMLRLYTQEDNVGLKVDPVIVLVLAVVFVFSVVFLHLFTKVARKFA